MKRSHMWGLISFGVFAVNLAIIVIGTEYEIFPKDNEFIMFYLMSGFLTGFIPLGIAAYYSHKDGEKFNWNFDG